MRRFGSSRLRTALFLMAAPGMSHARPPEPVCPAIDPPARLHDAPLPGPQNGEEGEGLLAMEEFWATRLTFPSGRFDPRWILAAAEEDRLVARGVPEGAVTYRRNALSTLSLDPNAFTSLGPKPLQSNGCLGCYAYGHVAGRVNVIAVDPVTPSVAYLGADGGGVWKTTNCCSTATTWAPATDLPEVSTIALDDLVIDPNDHTVVYAATGDLNFGSFSFGAAGILKSTDQGSTWTVLGADVFTPAYPEPAGAFTQYQAVGKVRVDPRNSSHVIAGTKSGLFFSYDSGASWSGPCVPDGYATQRQDVTGLLVSDNGASTDLYAAIGARGFRTAVQSNLDQNGANGVYRTTVPAAGCPATWSLLSNGWPAGTGGGMPYPTNVLGRIDLAMAPGNHQVIYAQVQAISSTAPNQRGGQLGVFRTTDGGTTWTQRSTVTALGFCGMDYNQNWYDQGLAVDPNHSDVVYMDTFDIWRSTNGGTTFTDLTCGYNGGTSVHVDQHALAFVPGSSSLLLAGSDGGAYVSTDADAASPTFTAINDSLSTIELYSGDITAGFATSSSPGINAGAQDNGSPTFVWSGAPGPAMWQIRSGGDGIVSRIEPKAGLRWYQETPGGALTVSTSGPTGGQSNATGGWTSDTNRSFLFPYDIDRYNCPDAVCDHMLAGSYRVWETTAGAIPATSWYANSPNLTKNTLMDRSFINQLHYAISTNSAAIAGTNDGNVWYGFGMGAGTANTASWVNVTGGNAVLPLRPILDVATDPVTATTGYAAVGGFNANTPATPGHVFQVVCTASCATFAWVDKSGNLPDVPADSILANPLYPQQVFAGTDWGLYYTNDITQNPPTWLRFQAGLPNVMIWDMVIDRGFTTLALFTRSRGAFAWPLPSGPVCLGDATAPAVTAPASITLGQTVCAP